MDKHNDLDGKTTARVVVAFVLSLLDNGNSLLSGLLECQIKRLHLVQNPAARLVNRTSMADHIMP
jgi:hypothetical protein